MPEIDPFVLFGIIVVIAVVTSWFRRKREAAVPSPPTYPAQLSDDMQRQIREHIGQKNKIEAVRFVREQTGWGLKDSKDYVDWVQDPRGPAPSLPLPRGQDPQQPQSASGLEDAVRAFVSAGNKLEAVKYVRENTGWGLKEAKDYVDRFERR